LEHSREMVVAPRSSKFHELGSQSLSLSKI
jgi:hypothetical protein